MSEGGQLIAQAGVDISDEIARLPDGVAASPRATACSRWIGTRRWPRALARAASQSRAGVRLISSSASSWVLPPVARGRRDALAQVADLPATFSRAAAVLRELPQFLGADGPKRYFIAAQSPAEMRGTGGFLGAYAVLTVDHGRFSFSPFRSVADLPNFAPGAIDAAERELRADLRPVRRGGLLAQREHDARLPLGRGRHRALVPAGDRRPPGRRHRGGPGAARRPAEGDRSGRRAGPGHSRSRPATSFPTSRTPRTSGSASRTSASRCWARPRPASSIASSGRPTPSLSAAAGARRRGLGRPPPPVQRRSRPSSGCSRRTGAAGRPVAAVGRPARLRPEQRGRQQDRLLRAADGLLRRPLLAGGVADRGRPRGDGERRPDDGFLLCDRSLRRLVPGRGERELRRPVLRPRLHGRRGHAGRPSGAAAGGGRARASRSRWTT